MAAGRCKGFSGVAWGLGFKASMDTAKSFEVVRNVHGLRRFSGTTSKVSTINALPLEFGDILVDGQRFDEDATGLGNGEHIILIKGVLVVTPMVWFSDSGWLPSKVLSDALVVWITGAELASLKGFPSPSRANWICGDLMEELGKKFVRAHGSWVSGRPLALTKTLATTQVA